MLFSTIGQYRVFLWMLAAGAAIGAWYALTAALRRVLSAGLWLGLMADALFGLGAAALFCLGLCTANYGQLRLYAVAAAALGFALFALGALPAGRRVVFALKKAGNHVFATVRKNRWISIIFR